MGDLSRQEAIEAIKRQLGNTEQAAHLMDWTLDMWVTMDELERLLDPQLARQVINARRPPTFEEVQHQDSGVSS